MGMAWKCDFIKRLWKAKNALLFLFGSSAPFTYRGREFDLFEHDHNCGWKTSLMTERALELAIANGWLEDHAHEDVVEVGAVSPYYWEGRVKTVIDPGDSHPAVTHRQSLFAFDFTGRSVLSISTLEHVGTGEYRLTMLRKEDCVAALRRLVEQSRSCLVTFPTGVAPALDAFVMSPEFTALQASLPLYVTVYKRHPCGNTYTVHTDDNIAIPYGHWPFGIIGSANGVVVIEKPAPAIGA